MAKIPKTKVYNPQKAEAYVGKGVLKSGGKVSKQLGSAKHTIGNMHFEKKKEIK